MTGCRTSITLGHVRPHKSHSHLTTLTLLLLLASGDISPNPGPLPSNIIPHTHHLSTSGCSRNAHALISIPLLPRTSPPLLCALWNARSVCNKLTSVHDLFISNSLNLLAITETWIQDSDTASPAALCHGGLHWTHSPRSGGQKGGGVGILLSPQSRFQILPSPPSLSLPSFESHCIRLFSPAPLRIAVIYRPPGPISRFLNDFSAWLPYFLSSEIPTIILGDFNIPVNVNSSATAQLLKLTTSFDLTQCIHSPTHSDGNTLDLANQYNHAVKSLLTEKKPRICSSPVDYIRIQSVLQTVNYLRFVHFF
ncbi:uncharacterized protein ACMZJ9_003441 [Mantella aurantiaca]